MKDFFSVVISAFATILFAVTIVFLALDIPLCLAWLFVTAMKGLGLL